MKKALLFVCATFFTISIHAQVHHRCYTMERDVALRAANPGMESLDDFEGWLQGKMAEETSSTHRTTQAVITIPVIVHIIHNGDAVGTGENLAAAQITSQIDVLNEDFRRMAGTPGYNTNAVGADCEIQFCLALQDPQGNALAEPGIHRVNLGSASWSDTQVDATVKPQTYWDPTKYLNIWTVRFSSASAGILGYAQFPNSSGLSGLNSNNGNANTDGVVIAYTAMGRNGSAQAPYNKGRTATHEVGHWLGLRHIWGDGGCNMDDYCSDTPDGTQANYGCPTNRASCGVPEMPQNYMDYTDDLCMNVFTACQKTRMRTVLQNSPRRSTLGSSIACNSVGSGSAPTASFTATPLSVCPGSSVTFTDNSANNPTSWSWNFPGGTPSTSSAQNPTVSYSSPGTYSVTLTVGNSFGTNATTQTNYITVGMGNTGKIIGTDFEESPQAAPGWGVTDPDNSGASNVVGQWAIYQVGGNTPGQYSAGIDLYNYTSIGQRDGIISPIFNTTGWTGTSLSFKYAYRRYSTSDTDSLIVKLSTNGGSSFPIRLFAKGASGLATNSLFNTGPFGPSTAADWCGPSSGIGAVCGSINMSAYDNLSNLRLMFESYNDYGNNIFIDDIQVNGTCANVPVPPSAAFSADVSRGCPTLTVHYTDNSTQNPTQWHWIFPGGLPSNSFVQNPTVTYATPGAYDVTLIATNAAGTDTFTLTSYVQVLSPPTTPVISATGNVLSTAGGWTSYQWNLNGTPINGATDSTHSAQVAGSYSVTITDGNGCSSTSAPFTYNPVETDPSVLNGVFKVYPNPAHDLLFVELPNTVSFTRIVLSDELGRTIYETRIENSGSYFRIPLKGLTPGIYLIMAEYGQGRLTRKISVW